MVNFQSKVVWRIVNHFPKPVHTIQASKIIFPTTSTSRHSFSHHARGSQPNSTHPLVTTGRSPDTTAAMDTRLHMYFPRRTLVLSEYIPRVDLTQARHEQRQPPNVLLFIGGMYDNFRSPRYVDDLAALFPRDEPDQKWSVFHVQLSSAGKSFGLVDLDRDVRVSTFSFGPCLCGVSCVVRAVLLLWLRCWDYARCARSNIIFTVVCSRSKR